MEIETKRRFRGKRQSTGKRILPTVGDAKLFQLLNRYRYLRSSHLIALKGGSAGYLKHRLGDLYHEANTPHGGPYLNRPEQRLQYANFFYLSEIYENTPRAEAFLKQYGLFDPLAVAVLHQGRTGPHHQFSHDLMCSDILSSVELGARQAGIDLITWPTVLARAPEKTQNAISPFTFHVDGGAITPDGFFGLRHADGARFFALEADRATMPLRRLTSEGRSIKEKFTRYLKISRDKLYKSHLGIGSLLVLIVTLNAEHMKNMLDLVKELTDGKGSPLFMFKTMSALGDFMKSPPPMPEIFEEPWLRAGFPPFSLKDGK